MTLGRTSSGAIKIKTDGDAGLRAVECACCGGGCVIPLSEQGGLEAYPDATETMWREWNKGGTVSVSMHYSEGGCSVSSSEIFDVPAGACSVSWRHAEPSSCGFSPYPGYYYNTQSYLTLTMGVLRLETPTPGEYNYKTVVYAWAYCPSQLNYGFNCYSCGMGWSNSNDNGYYSSYSFFQVPGLTTTVLDTTVYAHSVCVSFFEGGFASGSLSALFTPTPSP
jgi:hypothetical protein